MSKAKTASKNDPTTRQKQQEVLYNNKIVVPVLFKGTDSTFMAAEYKENESLVLDEYGNVMKWDDVSGSSS